MATAWGQTVGHAGRIVRAAVPHGMAVWLITIFGVASLAAVAEARASITSAPRLAELAEPFVFHIVSAISLLLFVPLLMWLIKSSATRRLPLPSHLAVYLGMSLVFALWHIGWTLCVGSVTGRFDGPFSVLQWHQLPAEYLREGIVYAILFGIAFVYGRPSAEVRRCTNEQVRSDGQGKECNAGIWLTLPDHSPAERIRTTEIDWIAASRNYAVVHTGDREIVTRMTMEALEEQLPEARFCRIHRSFIANLDHAIAISPEGSRDQALVLKNGVRLRIGRSRVQTVKDALT